MRVKRRSMKEKRIRNDYAEATHNLYFPESAEHTDFHLKADTNERPPSPCMEMNRGAKSHSRIR
ncbi:hypothetical protein E2C01_078900 [Portunus trituberculatus]|uniref:Uncharacterized protein n=1 Tax=Portunus trituberculatus TaxID=210409 RepID=A0A5B7IK29_PORTR|nr:hypothetical protein [Portunus trituberculatus]